MGIGEEMGMIEREMGIGIRDGIAGEISGPAGCCCGGVLGDLDLSIRAVTSGQTEGGLLGGVMRDRE